MNRRSTGEMAHMKRANIDADEFVKSQWAQTEEKEADMDDAGAKVLRDDIDADEFVKNQWDSSKAEDEGA